MTLHYVSLQFDEQAPYIGVSQNVSNKVGNGVLFGVEYLELRGMKQKENGEVEQSGAS
jgi:hypothetical protein